MSKKDLRGWGCHPRGAEIGEKKLPLPLRSQKIFFSKTVKIGLWLLFDYN